MGCEYRSISVPRGQVKTLIVVIGTLLLQALRFTKMEGLNDRVSSSNSDPKQLTGDENDAGVKPRDFFWDSVILYLVSVILALSAVDVVLEFIRGSGVACNVPDGTSVEYVNNFCAGSLPDTEFIPAFVFIHGMVIVIPHYLWTAHYGGYFDYFFSTVSSLDPLREEDTGEFSAKNHNIVRQLQSSFSTYKRNFVFYLYIGKLLVQLVVAVASLILSIVYFTDFNVLFVCPRDNNTGDPLWPLPTQVSCVFTSLKLLFWIRVADIFLIALIVLSIFWGLLWCASGHSSELGANYVARFTFQSGLAPDFYVPHIPVPQMCRHCLLRFFTSFPWPLKSPWISTDLDFLLLKLYRTNAGTGRVFKDVQIDMAVQSMFEEDQQVNNLHTIRHMDGIPIKLPEDDPSRIDLKWIFPRGEDGMIREFKSVPQNRVLIVPNSVRGAVLGFASRAPSNSGALSVSFGNSGIPLALARLFKRVGSINFSRFLKSVEDDDVDNIITVKLYQNDLVAVNMPENIMTTNIELHSQVAPKIDKIWYIRQGRKEIMKKTSFIVVGPMSSDNKGITVSLLFDQLTEYLEDGCILLIIRPVRISGKDTSKEFIAWEPPQCFKPYCHEVQVDRSVLTWSATKQQQERQQGQLITSKDISSSRLDVVSTTLTVGSEASAIKLETLEEGAVQPKPKEKTETASLLPHPPTPPPANNNMPRMFELEMLCGSIYCTLQFATYYYQPIVEEEDEEEEEEEEKIVQ